jgi:hypothetical protein
MLLKRLFHSTAIVDAHRHSYTTDYIVRLQQQQLQLLLLRPEVDISQNVSKIIVFEYTYAM